MAIIVNNKQEIFSGATKLGSVDRYSVNSIADRNSLPLSLRTPGMEVRTDGDGYGVLWKLNLEEGASDGELNNNNNWTIIGPASSKEFLVNPDTIESEYDSIGSQDIVFYVASSGGDDISNNGSEASPFATMQRVVDMFPETLSRPVTIKLSAGNHEPFVGAKFWTQVSNQARLRVLGHIEPVEEITFAFPATPTDIVGDDGYERYAQQYINFGTSYSTTLTEGEYFLYHTNNEGQVFYPAITQSALILDGSQGSDGYINNSGDSSCSSSKGDVAISAWNSTINIDSFRSIGSSWASISGGNDFGSRSTLGPIVIDSCEINIAFSTASQKPNTVNYNNCAVKDNPLLVLNNSSYTSINSCFFGESAILYRGLGAVDFLNGSAIRGCVFKDSTIKVLSGNVIVYGNLFTGTYGGVSQDFIIYLGHEFLFIGETYSNAQAVINSFGQNDFDPRNYGPRIEKGIISIGQTGFVNASAFPRGDMYINTSSAFARIQGGYYNRLDGRYYGFVGEPSTVQHRGTLNVTGSSAVWSDTSLANYNNPGDDVRFVRSNTTVSWADAPTSDTLDLSLLL